MNFLSHFYFDGLEDNHYWNTGLIIPDLLGFHKGRVRLTERKIEKVLMGFSINKSKSLDPLIDLSGGMVSHLRLDNLFHNMKLFKDSVEKLQAFFFSKTNESLSNFQAHIIIEMMIDKYIIELDSTISDDFYNSLRIVDIDKLSLFLDNFDNFHKHDFEKLFYRFSRSSYIGEYHRVELIVEIANRVSNSLGVNYFIESDKIYLFEYFYKDVLVYIISDIIDSINERSDKKNYYESI